MLHQAGTRDRYAAFSTFDTVLTMLGTVHEAICIYDETGKIIIANERMAELVGLSRKEIEEKPIDTLLLQENGSPFYHHTTFIDTSEHPMRLLCRRPKEGSTVSVYVRAKRLGESEFYLACFIREAQKDTSSDAFPLSPVLTEEQGLAEQFRPLQSEASENLSLMLSETTGSKHRRGEKIQIAAEELWIQMHAKKEAPTREEYQQAIADLAAVMHCEIWEVQLTRHTLLSKAIDTSGKSHVFPFTFHELTDEATYGNVRVILPQENAELASWLQKLDPGKTGFLALMSPNDRQAPYDFLVLRDAQTYGKLDDLQVILFKRFIQNIYRDERYANQQAQDTYISQTLQLGMGNRLYDVEGLVAEGLYNSATATAHIGGDFYTVMRLSPNKACIIIGDVTGKGVAAASVSSAIKTALVAYAWEGQTPSYMARAANDFFMGFSRLETFVTAFIGILDTKDGSLSYCSAGHLPALIWRAATGKVEKLNVQSGVIGAFQEMIYKDGRANLFPGDKLFLYTDGTTEARNTHHEFFGEHRLADLLAKTGNTPTKDLPETILSHIINFSQSKLEDDIALLVVERDQTT